MGLGIFEDYKLRHVPGTVLLDDRAACSEEITQDLKHGAGSDAHIVLSPQPSDDPNDPLNWPLWKKEMIIAILSLGAMLNASTNAPFLNSAYYQISVTLKLPITTIVLVSGYNLLAAGLASPFVCAFSRKYGKRPVFLASTLFCIIGTAIGEASTSYRCLLAARVVQGFSTTAFQSLILASVGDMYFVHQRGVRVAFINFIFNAASSLASNICGVVFQKLGWLWLFHMFQIFVVVQFVLMFLFCPETTYLRARIYETDVAQDEKFADLEHLHTSTSSIDASIPKKTFVQELAIFNGVYSHDNFFKCLFTPFLTLLNPAACYAVLVSGLLNSWFVGSAMIIAGIFSGPPWNFGPAEIGYLAWGPFVGGAIGSLFVALLADPIIKMMTKRNKGVYEPEFKLVFMSISAVGCGTGMFLFGWAMGNKRSAVLCAFLQGLEVFGVVNGVFATFSYGLDAFRSQSNEIFVMNVLFKNLMAYCLSIFANNWVAAKGPEEIMYMFGGTSIFMSVLAIPVYIFGKKMRSWWSRHDLFVTLQMKSRE